MKAETKGATMNATESKLAARIHAAELGRTHKIEFETFGPHHIDYIFSHLRTVRERAEKGTILSREIREKLSLVCVYMGGLERRGVRTAWQPSVSDQVLLLSWLSDPEEGAGRTRYVRRKWTF
jgi:hypothetical protein